MVGEPMTLKKALEVLTRPTQTATHRRKIMRAYALGRMDCRRGRGNNVWKYEGHNCNRPYATAYRWGYRFWST